MKNSAIAYVRVSSLPQKEKYSPDIQRKAIQAYADKNGIFIEKWFEEARSGWRAQGRIDFYDMLEFAKSQKIRDVIFYIVSRISRNQEDWLAMKKDCLILHNASKGVSYDLNDKKHWRVFIDEMRELVEAEKFSYETGERASDGMKAAAERGDYPGCISLGYMAEYERGGKRKVVIDPEKGPLIQKLFSLYATGTYNLGTASEVMRDLGLRTKKGKKVQRQVILKILRNPFYIGQFAWAGKTYAGNYEPLITRGLFDAVQDVLDGKSNHSGKWGRDFKYKGLLTCGLCGSAVVGEIKKGRYIYYHCSQGKAKCSRPAYREEAIDDLFQIEFSSLYWPDEAYKQLRESLRKDFHSKEELSKLEIPALKKELEQLKAKKDKAVDLALEEKLPADLLREKLTSLENRQAEVEAKLAQLERVKADTIDKILDSLVLFNSFRNKYLACSPEIQKKLWRLILYNCKVYPKERAEKGEMPLEFIWNEPFRTIFAKFAENENPEEKGEKINKRAWRDSNSRPAA